MNNRLFTDAIMGLVTGDALGCPVEYESREWLAPGPVDGMRAHGMHDQPAGTWTDDSQMMLAALDSICDLNRIDPQDIMDRLLLWYDDAAYTPYGIRFDIGISIEATFLAYRSGVPLDLCGGHGERDNGNAALSRAVPVCLFLMRREEAGLITAAEAVAQLEQATALTHAHRRSLLAAGLLYFFCRHLTDPARRLSVCLQEGMDDAWAYYTGADPTDELELMHFARFREMEQFAGLPAERIASTGYVVDTLEAALWSLLTTDNYRDAVLRAVNLGGDTDSIGAVTGALAGLYYGARTIPSEWLEVIARRDWIESLCERADGLPLTAEDSGNLTEGSGPSVDGGLAIVPPDPDLTVPAEAASEAGQQEKASAEEERASYELVRAASARERLLEEIRLLRARIEQLTAERDDLIYRECPELQAEYNRKIGGLELEALEIEVQVRALRRMIELLQAQLNRAERPDVVAAKKWTDEEYRKFEEELEKRAERIRREEKHAQRRAEQERKSRARYEQEQAGRELTVQGETARDAGGDAPEEEEPRREQEAQETLEQELKRLWRRIVKKLHPDVNPDITPEEKEMFLRAKEAYGLGDVETLREIAARIEDEEMLSGGGIAELPIAELTALRDRLREQMEQLLAEIRRIRNSFPYSSKSFLRDPVKVRAKQEDLKKYIADCKQVIEELRERIAKMQASAGGKKKKA